MSTRRYATVIYGYSLPVDFERAAELKADETVDMVVGGMNGEYFLVGKAFVNYALDSYEDADGGVAPRLLSPSMTDRVKLKSRLKKLFPEHKGLLGMWYVLRYV